jgi:hypothetical protein
MERALTSRCQTLSRCSIPCLGMMETAVLAAGLE